MSVNQKPVKSSRVFLGHIHDVNVERLSKLFKVASNHFKNIKPDKTWIARLTNDKDSEGPLFFAKNLENYENTEIDLRDFSDFNEAYHRLMIDLSNMVIKSIQLIISDQDKTNCLYISGGFAKNELFTRLLATKYKDKKVYTSEIDNATSLGAALILYKEFGFKKIPSLNLELKRVDPL